ncbi:MAG TPA: 30S ribosomal protein S7 [Coxiellaceae bacterium]|nr:30S ribosomal protein S7 [Coxiellaceae bacterium]
MSRRKAAPKRNILPDPLFKSEDLAKFINTVMKDGKKSVAEAIVYGALAKVAERHHHKAKEESDEGEGGEGGRAKKAAPADIRTSETARQVALEAFSKAIDSITPTVEVKSRRVGGSNYQVPVEIRATRRLALARRWLVEFASSRPEKTMVLRLAGEIMDAIEGRGGAVKKREDVHRMARANQAFAHYRW